MDELGPQNDNPREGGVCNSFIKEYYKVMKSYMVNVNSIQELLKCLNPLMIVPYPWNINRNHSITLRETNNMVKNILNTHKDLTLLCALTVTQCIFAN